MAKLGIKLHYIGAIDSPFRGLGENHRMHLHLFCAQDKPRIHIAVFADTEKIIPEEDLSIYLVNERIQRWFAHNAGKGRVADSYETT